MSSAKLGSSPHQKSQSSRRPGVWCLRHTLRTSTARHRLKLHRIGSSSVTGNRMGDEVGPCHTNRLHLIPVRSARQNRLEWQSSKLAPFGTKHELILSQRGAIVHCFIIQTILQLAKFSAFLLLKLAVVQLSGLTPCCLELGVYLHNMQASLQTVGCFG